MKKRIENIIKSNSFWLWDKLHDEEKENLVDQLYLLAKQTKWTKDIEIEKRMAKNYREIMCAVIKTYGTDNQIELPMQSFVTQIGNENIEKVQSSSTGKWYFRIIK